MNLIWLESDNYVESILTGFRERDNNSRPDFNAITREELLKSLNNYDERKATEAVHKMEQYELLIKSSSGNYGLSRLGYEVLYNGGWKKYLEKEEVDRTLKRWQYYWFWPAVAIGFMGLSWAIYSTDQKQQSIKTLQSLQEHQAKAIQSLQKSVDSLRGLNDIHPATKQQTSDERKNASAKPRSAH